MAFQLAGVNLPDEILLLLNTYLGPAEQRLWAATCTTNRQIYIVSLRPSRRIFVHRDEIPRSINPSSSVQGSANYEQIIIQWLTRDATADLTLVRSLIERLNRARFGTGNGQQQHWPIQIQALGNSFSNGGFPLAGDYWLWTDRHSLQIRGETMLAWNLGGPGRLITPAPEVLSNGKEVWSGDSGSGGENGQGKGRKGGASGMGGVGGMGGASQGIL